jgi:PPOX class probable F420-dependent enzyme
MREPRPSAPRIPASYGVPRDGSGSERLPWSWAVERLAAARNYWICTTRPDGRPHAVPVWGLWLEDAVWFSTARDSQKGRNLARNPALTIHLESGDETVILEGDAEEVRDRESLERFADAYDAKYDYRPDASGDGSPVYLLRPRAALTWLERDYPRTATRWVFE